MPTAFKNAKYYDLVNNTLLNPELLTKYIEEINPKNLVIVENPELLTFNLMPLVINTSYIYQPPTLYITEYFVYNKNRVDFYSVWHRLHRHDIFENIISNYIMKLWYRSYISKYNDYNQVNLLKKLVKNNTYYIRTMLIKAMCDAYFIKYVAPSVIRAIAINKIRRNKLYFCGLAKKISMRDCGIPLEVSN